MEQAAEAAAAAAGGMFSAGVLFPLEVIKTNMQAQTKAAATASPSACDKPQAVKEEEEEEERVGGGQVKGPAGGVGEETLGKTEHKEATLTEGGDGVGMPTSTAASGIVGGGSSSRGGGGKPATTMLSTASKIWSSQGLLGFYKGVGYASGQSGLEKAAYFYGYSWLRALALSASGQEELSTPADLALGYLSEAFHLPFTIPIEVVLTKIMTSRDKTNAFAVVQTILKESGPGGFYKGIQAYVVLCLKPAIQYAVFNRLKAWQLAYNRARPRKGSERWETTGELTAVQAFVLGALSRAVATIIVFPYIRAKVIIMSRSGAGQSRAGGAEGRKSSGGASSSGVIGGPLSILREEGVSALFQGITPEITRGVLSAALMLMVKEKIHSVVKGAIMGSQRV